MAFTDTDFIDCDASDLFWFPIFSRALFIDPSRNITIWKNQKSCEELKAKTGQLEKEMVEAKKCERAEVLEKVKEMCKKFSFTVRMLKGALAEGNKKKWLEKTIS